MKKNVPVVIFAGGIGSRLGEYTSTIPKPLVTVGGIPILYRIMQGYSKYGFDDFLILGGYLFDILRTRLLADAHGLGDLEINFETAEAKPIGDAVNPKWNVRLIDTGAESETGRRLALARTHLQGSESFFLTYGDGISDINFEEQYARHKQSGKLATVTAVRSPSKYGHLEISSDGTVGKFVEKPTSDGPWINGGFFVMENSVFRFFDAESNDALEKGLLPALAGERELNSFAHEGFWKSMDSPKDKAELDALARDGQIPGDF